jgi:hypothetical protein
MHTLLTGWNNSPALPSALESGEDIPPLRSAAAVGGLVMESIPGTARVKKESIPGTAKVKGIKNYASEEKTRWHFLTRPTRNQSSFYFKKSGLPPSQEEEDDSSSLSSSKSSTCTKAGAEHVGGGGAKSKHHKLPLQTQEERDMEHGFETLLPILQPKSFCLTTSQKTTG